MADEQTQFERIIARLKIPSAPREEHRRSLWQRMVEVFQHALRRYEKAGPLHRRWITLSAPGGVLHGRARQATALAVVGVALAALVLHLTVGLVAAFSSLRAWMGAPPPPPPTVMWTEVLDHLRGARTIRFKMTVEPSEGTSQTYLVSVLRPARLRVVGAQWTEVIDQHYRKVLTLYADRKTYQLGLLEHQPAERRLPDVMSELAALDVLSGRSVSSPIPDTAVFTAEKDDRQWTIRVDARTAQPIFIRRLTPADNLSITLTDFVWSAPLDETDFLLVPPPGYREE